MKNVVIFLLLLTFASCKKDDNPGKSVEIHPLYFGELIVTYSNGAFDAYSDVRVDVEVVDDSLFITQLTPVRSVSDTDYVVRYFRGLLHDNTFAGSDSSSQWYSGEGQFVGDTLEYSFETGLFGSTGYTYTFTGTAQ